ncbi:MAG: hypothetical protein Q9194_007458 [Teloschistes cf. exilis]
MASDSLATSIEDTPPPAPEVKTGQEGVETPSTDDGEHMTRGQKKRAKDKRKKLAKKALIAQASSAAEGSSAAETQPADASADTTTAATGAPVDTDNLRDLLSEGAAGTNKIPDFMDRVKDPKQLIDELLRAEKAGEEPNLANIELLDETEKGTKNDSRWTGLSVDHKFLSFLKAAQGGAPGVLG